MTSLSHAQQVADAALLNKFMEQLEQYPLSDFGKAVLKAYRMPAGTARNKEIVAVLKKHGFEGISPDGLEALLHRRPVDVSKIQPPESLGDEKDPTKPEVSFAHFAGAYKVTSAYSPPGWKITVKANNEDKTKGVISWGTKDTHQEFSAKFQSSIQKGGTILYWAVWGDKDAEWWSVQFFGPSGKTLNPSFVGFRHSKENKEHPDRFEGEMIVSKHEPAETWLVICFLIGAFVAGTAYAASRRNQQPGQQVVQSETQEAEARIQEERERREAERRLEIMKEAATHMATTEFLKSWAEPRHKDLIQHLEVKIGNILVKEYQHNKDLQEADYDKPLNEKVRAEVDAMKNTELESYVERGSLKAEEIAERFRRDHGFDISATEIKKLAVERFSRATEYDVISNRYTGLVGDVVDKIRQLADAKITDERIQKAKAEIEERLKMGKELIDSARYQKLAIIITSKGVAEARSGFEADVTERAKYEAEAKEHQKDLEREITKIREDVKIELAKREALVKNLGELEAAVWERAKNQERQKKVNDHSLYEKKMAEGVKRITQRIPIGR
ncbi:hypothetical protein CDV36_004488 [Fusarium kuroshium]|uniref:Uncharacterized protein n=1 Tax=Fusarium kuroshium TaxID=2010991 RepID=A0A3M2SE35_9HYPO|nr:hypothetical protein CDV36_004488 [Fusarium kuroshium]